MAKVIVGAGFSLDMALTDVSGVFSYDVTHSNTRRVELEDSGTGFTAVIQGPAFGDFDGNGLPHSGEIATFTLNFGGNLVFKISKIDLSIEELQTFIFPSPDPEGLRQLLFDGNDQIFGGALADNLLGYANGDLLEGGLGNDTLNGGKGNDLITGDGGKDLLIGGTGVDIFKFKALSDSDNRPGDADYIQDLKAVDIIDLRMIDADVDKPNNNAFHLVDGFTGNAAEAWLHYQADSDRTFLKLDVDGDGAADMIIVLKGDQTAYVNFVL